jgi:hypothetical protein
VSVDSHLSEDDGDKADVIVGMVAMTLIQAVENHPATTTMAS